MPQDQTGSSKPSTRSNRRPPPNANSIAQYAALAAFTGDQSIVEEHRREFEMCRDLFFEGINAVHGFHIDAAPEGAFYLFVSVRALLGKSQGGRVIDSSAALATYLLDNCRVAAIPGEAFGAPGFLRFSFAASMDKLKDALGRLLREFGPAHSGQTDT